SIAMMRSAPASAAPLTADNPTPPQPMMATVAPGSTLAALNTAPTPVITPQPTSAARSSGMSGSIFTIEFSCTNISSAKDDRLRHRVHRLPPLPRRARGSAGRHLDLGFPEKMGGAGTAWGGGPAKHRKARNAVATGLHIRDAGAARLDNARRFMPEHARGR